MACGYQKVSQRKTDKKRSSFYNKTDLARENLWKLGWGGVGLYQETRALCLSAYRAVIVTKGRLRGREKRWGQSFLFGSRIGIVRRDQSGK